MARQKEKPQPLFTIKAAFYASLDNASQKAIQLLSACRMAVTALERDDIDAPTREIARRMLQEASEEFRAALSTNEGDD